jgi:hypothetical protein
MNKLLISVLFILSTSCSYKAAKDSILKNSLESLESRDIQINEDQENIQVNLNDVFADPEFTKKNKIVDFNSKNSQIKVVDGQFFYTPEKHHFGVDDVSVFFQELASKKIIKTNLRFLIKGVEDDPFAYDDYFEVSTERLEIDVLANDIDVDGQEIQLVSVEEEIDEIEASIRNNKILIERNSEFEGVLTLKYFIRDEAGKESSAFIYLSNSTPEILSLAKKIPLRVIFLGNSDQLLSNDAASDAEQIKEIINRKFQSSQASQVQFELTESLSIADDELNIHCNPIDSDCKDFDKVVQNYNQLGSVTLVFVKKILGSVAGIARVGRLPTSMQATVVAEYGSLKKFDGSFDQKGSVYIHELGHLIGMEHTQQFDIEENKWLYYGSCGQNLRYLQSAGQEEGESFLDDNGVAWDFYGNSMKSVIGTFIRDEGLFTSGYKEVFQKLTSCYQSRI